MFWQDLAITGIFDGGEDRQGPPRLAELLDVDIEHPLEQPAQLRP